jgi:hypothetical protein
MDFYKCKCSWRSGNSSESEIIYCEINKEVSSMYVCWARCFLPIGGKVPTISADEQAMISSSAQFYSSIHLLKLGRSFKSKMQLLVFFLLFKHTTSTHLAMGIDCENSPKSYLLRHCKIKYFKRTEARDFSLMVFSSNRRQSA